MSGNMEEICDAIDSDNHFRLLEWIRISIIDEKNEVGNTPLIYSAFKGSKACLRLLIGRKANIEIRGGNGRTALMQAAEKGNLECVEILLKHGADIESSDDYGLTALALAANFGQIETIKLLIKHKANIEGHGKLNQTERKPTETENNECVSDLSTQEADHKTNYKNRDTPLIFAAYEGHVNVVKLLIENKANIHARGEFGRTALLNAAENGHTECIEELLKHGADIEVKDDDGKSALSVAAFFENNNCLILLLEYGAEIDTHDRYSNTALAVAAFHGHFKTVELLLQHNADVDCLSLDGDTPLILAARQGKTNCVDLLLKHGADINKSNKSENTALHWAVGCSHVNTAKRLLLQPGIYLDKKNEEGETPYDVAIQSNSSDIIKMFRRESTFKLCNRQKIISDQNTESCYSCNLL